MPIHPGEPHDDIGAAMAAAEDRALQNRDRVVAVLAGAARPLDTGAIARHAGFDVRDDALFNGGLITLAALRRAESDGLVTAETVGPVTLWRRAGDA